MKTGVSWTTMTDGTCLTGFSHGNAGIATALSRLAAASGREEFADLAMKAIAFENALFDAGPQNWPDLRSDPSGPPQFMNTWCHGAPGIGMGRLAMADLALTQPYTDDIDAAIRSTRRFGIGTRDGLCCGALGRSDLFLLKATRENKTVASDLALSWASRIIARKRTAGNYRLTGRTGMEFFDPSFFQGVSGIGYQLLRIAKPTLLPSVLTWE